MAAAAVLVTSPGLAQPVPEKPCINFTLGIAREGDFVREVVMDDLFEIVSAADEALGA